MSSPANSREVFVDPTAIVHPGAELDSGVTVGPYSIIGEGVRVGKGTTIGAHVVIDKWTTIGQRCAIYQFAAIGAPPQDIGYKGERTEIEIGDDNVIREFVTIHRATTKDKLKTVIGSRNFLMNYVHVAHDCVVGNNVIMANSATLGGHVSIGDSVVIGGIVAVHQFVRVGQYAIIGGASAVSRDVPPYVMAVGNRARLFGLNKVGLRRQGFTRLDLDEIKRAYALLFRSARPLKEAMDELSGAMPDSVHAKRFVDFIKGSKRGVVREKKKSEWEEED